MIHLRTICALTMLSVGIAAITSATYASPSSDDSTVAATTSTKTKLSKKAKTKSTSASNSSAVAGQTDIVAKVDLPMVTNILPWKEDEGAIPKNILEFSALKDSLTPTDRDRLASEIRYTSILNEPLDQK